MAPKGRLASFLRPGQLIWFSICLHWEAFTKALRQEGLAAFLHLPQIREAAIAKLFCITSNDFIASENTTIVPSLVKSASGIILELGTGPGNQLHRFDTSLVKYIYGVEPNSHFRDEMTAKLEAHSLLRERYKLLDCGVEDSDVLREEGIVEGRLDTVLCIQVLCALRDPGGVMREVWKLLRPGGKFIFWEHGWSRNQVTVVEQAFWNPAWSTFVGCHMTRNVLADILNGGEWENPEDIEEPEDLFSCLPRIQGALVKKA